MGLKEIYAGNVPPMTNKGSCGLCAWLATLDAEDALYANKIIWDRLDPERYLFGIHPAAARLRAGGFQYGHNVVRSHRRDQHDVA